MSSVPSGTGTGRSGRAGKAGRGGQLGHARSLQVTIWPEQIAEGRERLGALFCPENYGLYRVGVQT
jgi:hypothetical protein